MCRRREVVLLTIDPLSPNNTVIGFDGLDDDIRFTPVVGCGGGGVLTALLRADFDIEEVVAGDSYIHYVLTHSKFKRRHRETLQEELDNLGCEPIT